MECGCLLPLSARLLAGALWAGSKLPAQKARASSRTPYRHDFDVPLPLHKRTLDKDDEKVKDWCTLDALRKLAFEAAVLLHCKFAHRRV